MFDWHLLLDPPFAAGPFVVRPGGEVILTARGGHPVLRVCVVQVAPALAVFAKGAPPAPIAQGHMLINECVGVRHLAAGFVGARVDISIAQEVDNLLAHPPCGSVCVWWLHGSIHQEFVHKLR